MFHRHLNVLSVVLLLAGCGGGEFSSAAGPEGEGTGGSSEADAGTGGVTGVTGGQAAVTGGAAGAGGNLGGAGSGGPGGQQPGTGGGTGGAGGAGAGGQQATAGSATGGSGAGGAGTVCKPPKLMPEDLPQTVVWESYLGKSPNYLGSYDVCVACQQSPCTTCSLSWWPVDQSADGVTVTAKATLSGCAPVAVNMGACASDLSTSSCTIWNTDNFYTAFTFQLLPNADGTGYRAVHRAGGSTGGIGQPQGGCNFDARAYNEAVGAGPAQSLVLSIRETLVTKEWSCGS